jgi:succinyl-CoA synthetase beta subunit
VVDRASGGVAVIASTEGGMDIEEVAAHTPEKIIDFPIDITTGLQAFHTRKLNKAFGLSGETATQAAKLLKNLYTCVVEKDLDMLEINPLVVTDKGNLLVLDAKVNIDDNAMYRHPELEALRDEDEEDAMEREAAKHSLNYVKLDGKIGCMVNGAGLAMATMDIIKLAGSEPANFLDVGGGATKERVTAAFKLILSDKNVEAILVNIFGGIMRCDIIADGIITAAREVSLHVPLVVRLEGTNVQLGKDMLAKSGLPIVSADNLGDAAQKVVHAVNTRKAA